MSKGEVFAGALAAAGLIAGCAIYGQCRAWYPAAPKPQNWDEVRFGIELRELLCTYQKRGRVTVMTPPKAFVVPRQTEIAYDIRDEMLQKEREIIVETADTLRIPVIDLYGFTEHHPEWFPDGIHPNARGNRKIAKHIEAFCCKER